MKTSGIFTFKGASLIALIFTSAISALAFIWPFLIHEKQGHPQWIFLLATPFALLLLMVSVSNNELDSKSVALLAVLTALIAALRPMGTGAVGIEPMWFVLILSARVFGPSFGFLLGVLSMFLSAILTGGLGPWVAYQSFAAGWIGLGVALIPRMVRGKREIFILALYAVVAAEFFGVAMDLQFWPWALGADTQLSYLAGAPISENLSRFFSYHFLSAMAWDIPRAVFTASLITIAGKPILQTLRRSHTRAAFLTPIEFIEHVKVQKAAR
ncbi:ECF transporter S component [Actinobacteria bacterium IMCC25003]|nr:ECF transporter S component [Actinobacteria bacterium IMCC25003]